MRGAIVLLAGLALAAPATAAPPLVTATAAPDTVYGPDSVEAPSVPAYPASHGCVRIPMWIAPSLFSDHGFGTSVVVRL